MRPPCLARRTTGYAMGIRLPIAASPLETLEISRPSTPLLGDDRAQYTFLRSVHTAKDSASGFGLIRVRPSLDQAIRRQLGCSLLVLSGLTRSGAERCR